MKRFLTSPHMLCASPSPDRVTGPSIRTQTRSLLCSLHPACPLSPCLSKASSCLKASHPLPPCILGRLFIHQGLDQAEARALEIKPLSARIEALTQSLQVCVFAEVWTPVHLSLIPPYNQSTD